MIDRYSEPYNATGGLAAIGVLNQLGRPDIEPLEVLVREAVQNCWDAKRPDRRSIEVNIGTVDLDPDQARTLRRDLLVDPPPGLPLARALADAPSLLYFADFGTAGLGGPTRADAPGHDRDFVDFIRNIGQPPDKDLGGGSFGYGKAAFYIASAARTIIVDTLCDDGTGTPERRLIACGLGDNYDDSDGTPHTGRHWWGRLREGVPEPLLGSDAAEMSARVGLPTRDGLGDRGTTVAIVSPDVHIFDGEDNDRTTEFIAEAIAWNFWPRMVDTPGATRRTMRFTLTADGRPVRIPDPRTHQRLRSFVQAMDRLREEPNEAADEFTIDRSIDARRPIQRLGRLVLVKDHVTPISRPSRPVPRGAHVTADSLHHVALMRNAELVVRYLACAVPIAGEMGYAGAFRCAVDVDEAFRQSEPPTHDDWVSRSVADKRSRSFVKVALDRIDGVCREVAGFQAPGRGGEGDEGISLGEFADALATFMPGAHGPGARQGPSSRRPREKKRSRGPAQKSEQAAVGNSWVDANPSPDATDTSSPTGRSADPDGAPRRRRLPQIRISEDPAPSLASDDQPVIRFPFELRTHDQAVHLSARVEVMANDGSRVEDEAPLGGDPPPVRAWIDPSGKEHSEAQLQVPPTLGGAWAVEVPLVDDLMVRVDLRVEAA